VTAKPKAPAPLKGKKLEAEISRLFYAHGNRRQFNMMDLGKISEAGRAANAAGADMEAAMRAAMDKYEVHESGGRARASVAGDVLTPKVPAWQAHAARKPASYPPSQNEIRAGWERLRATLWPKHTPSQAEVSKAMHAYLESMRDVVNAHRAAAGAPPLPAYVAPVPWTRGPSTTDPAELERLRAAFPQRKTQRKPSSKKGKPAGIRFQRHAVTDGTHKARVWYSLDNRVDRRACVTLYAKDHDSGDALHKLFPDDYKNETDSQRDYFEKGKVNLFKDSPHYATARAAALSFGAEPGHAATVDGVSGKPGAKAPAMSTAEIEAELARLEHEDDALDWDQHKTLPAAYRKAKRANAARRRALHAQAGWPVGASVGAKPSKLRRAKRSSSRDDEAPPGLALVKQAVTRTFAAPDAVGGTQEQAAAYNAGYHDGLKHPKRKRRLEGESHEFRHAYKLGHEDGTAERASFTLQRREPEVGARGVSRYASPAFRAAVSKRETWTGKPVRPGESASIKRDKAGAFTLVVDADERGEFRAHVENPKGFEVFEYSNREVSEDDDTGETFERFGEIWLVEAGYMRHGRDTAGLHDYLVQIGVMAPSATLRLQG